MTSPWKMAALLAAGLATGLAVLVAVMSQAHSYLSDRPEVCINCHIMRPQYATWKASAHHTVATCNDCHVPHENLARKFAFKGEDGSRHSFIFTMRTEPQVIRIREAGMKVVQANCLRCHGQLVDATAMGKLSFTHDTNPRPASAAPLWSVVDGRTVETARSALAAATPATNAHGDPSRLCIDCHRETPHGRISSLSSAPEARIQRLGVLGGGACPIPLGQQLLDQSPTKVTSP